MALTKDTTVIIGVIIAVAVIVVAAVVVSGSTSASTNSDGLTSSEIQSKLQNYADIINNSGDNQSVYVVVSGDVKKTSATSSVSGECAILPTKGTAKVVDGELRFSASESYGSGSFYYTLDCEYIIPYHAIVAIKTATRTN